MIRLDTERIAWLFRGQYEETCRSRGRKFDGRPTVLLIGADGMLGRAFVRLFAELEVGVIATTIQDLDLLDADKVNRRVGDSGPWVINCAAWTNVDGAEADEAGATAVNGQGTRNLAEACFDHESFLVTFGTDYVFSGFGKRPYRADDPLEPLNAYGRSKAAGELALEPLVVANAPEHATFLHLRTSWLYAPWGNNFVRTIAKLLREKPSIKVVNDQHGRPTSAEHLARVTLALLDQGARGILHATDGGQCTWYQFACQIGTLTGAPGKVEPCTSAEFPRPAKRPAYSVLDISETERLIGPMPDWRANLADVVARLEA
jgi:dTDP-4-dehydrorhamnose reductase